MTGALRAAVISKIADHLVTRTVDHPLRVAVDGITAAGKTTFADELAAAVEDRGRAAIRVSMDGFHNPRAHRYRQGRDSAVGYYQDAYDFASLARLVLAPLGPGGDGRYRSAVHNLATDEPVDAEPTTAAPGSVLVVDGTFLQSAVLAGRWDEVVYVDTSFAVASDRAVLRDADALGGAAVTERVYEQRYHAACRLYLSEYRPADTATIIVGNDDLANPVLHRCGRRDLT